jgi:hypothetical protein
MRARCFALAGLALLTGLTGCGGSSSGISGSVTYEGQPVENGNITFNPADGKGPQAGGTITDGQYKIDHVTPGRKVVKIQSVPKIVFAQDMEARKNAPKPTAVVAGPPEGIPPDAEGNNATIDVVAGHQEFNFQLKRKAK